MTAALTAAFAEEKLKRDDVFLSVRMAQGIENENEPTWKDVKNMKDILQGCSPTSPEGIELNLARATKVNFMKGVPRSKVNLLYILHYFCCAVVFY